MLTTYNIPVKGRKITRDISVTQKHQLENLIGSFHISRP